MFENLFCVVCRVSFWGSALKIFFPCTEKSFPPHSGNASPSFDDTSEVQGERRVELVRTLLSRSLHSPLHLKCNGKDTTSSPPFCYQK